MKKRITSILALVMALMLCLTACGGKTEGNARKTGGGGSRTMRAYVHIR